MWHLGPQAAAGIWYAIESPTTRTLHSVVETSDGPYAVGGSGTLVRRQDDGDWAVVFEDGPTARDNALYAAAATDDGQRIWFAGSSGSLGYYDVTTHEKHDYSAPRGKTSTWEAMAVAGEAGSEKVMVANGSGEVLVGFVNGCCPQWGPVKKPGGGNEAGAGGSGSTIAALAAGPDGDGYAVNTSGSVYRTTDAGAWERIGIENAAGTFTDIYVDDEHLLVASGTRIYRYERNCDNWTPLGVSASSLNEIDRHEDVLIAVGDNGAIYRNEDDEWVERWSMITHDLYSVTVADGVHVAVGKGGTIVERGDRAIAKMSGAEQTGSEQTDTQSGDSTTS
ncbi:WD40/YVTN/BNR-like repeat-containing protein [Halospeciosus flavus]|uniref:WD40/YVTN/BNR-like repeat-containing protein n=2 Tax=Halospeciosus flavus TaxID=3032283 RepID=A0ABD5Z2G7_9EURY|nr:hypothetical protein [Halospeciosus flavus]